MQLAIVLVLHTTMRTFAEFVPILDAAVIDVINADPASPWKAKMNERFSTVSKDEARQLCNTHPQQRGTFPAGPRSGLTPPPKLPDVFDARTHWNGENGTANCSTMVTVQNQGE